MRISGVLLVLAVALTACGGDDGSDPFAALDAERDAVPDYEVDASEDQGDRCVVRLEVDDWSPGAAEAAAADYLDDEGPCGNDETVVQVTFEARPEMGCTLFWPDDERNVACPS